MAKWPIFNAFILELQVNDVLHDMYAGLTGEGERRAFLRDRGVEAKAIDYLLRKKDTQKEKGNVRKTVIERIICGTS